MKSINLPLLYPDADPPFEHKLTEDQFKHFYGPVITPRDTGGIHQGLWCCRMDSVRAMFHVAPGLTPSTKYPHLAKHAGQIAKYYTMIQKYVPGTYPNPITCFSYVGGMVGSSWGFTIGGDVDGDANMTESWSTCVMLEDAFGKKKGDVVNHISVGRSPKILGETTIDHIACGKMPRQAGRRTCLLNAERMSGLCVSQI